MIALKSILPKADYILGGFRLSKPKALDNTHQSNQVMEMENIIKVVTLSFKVLSTITNRMR